MPKRRAALLQPLQVQPVGSGGIEHNAVPLAVSRIAAVDVAAFDGIIRSSCQLTSQDPWTGGKDPSTCGLS